MSYFTFDKVNFKLFSIFGFEKLKKFGQEISKEDEIVNVPLLNKDPILRQVSTNNKMKVILDTPPIDKHQIIYYIFVIHGIGTLMSWNMLINAKSYFVDYKLSEEYTHEKTEYAKYFMASLTFASQLPNLILCWTNVFLQSTGIDVSVRIAWSIVIDIILFIFTIILAIVDTSQISGEFFWVTMFSIVLLNMSNGIYQSSIYGLAARLPAKYTGAVVFGNNISGTITSTLSIICGSLISDNYKTGAIYYFISVLVILSICFDTYYALPLNKFYRYYDTLSRKAELAEKQNKLDNTNKNLSYIEIIKKCRIQLINVFLTFFVTLALFPTIYSDIKRSDPNFLISLVKDDALYTNVTCFLAFNVSALIGSFLPSIFVWPKPKYLIYITTARLLYIPLFLILNYQPKGIERTLPVLLDSDIIYLICGITMALTHGYFSSVSLMYVPKCVEQKDMSMAGMFGAAFLSTGIFAGVVFGGLGIYLVSF